MTLSVVSWPRQCSGFFFGYMSGLGSGSPGSGIIIRCIVLHLIINQLHSQDFSGIRITSSCDSRIDPGAFTHSHTVHRITLDYQWVTHPGFGHGYMCSSDPDQIPERFIWNSSCKLVLLGTVWVGNVSSFSQGGGYLWVYNIWYVMLSTNYRSYVHSRICVHYSVTN